MILAFSLILGLTFGVFAEEGVTDTEIHVGSWSPQTGPASAYGGLGRSIDAYFKWLNDEGGIHGRKIIYHHFDDSYNPAKTIAGVKQLQEQVGIFAWVSGVGTPTGLAVMDYLMERKIPWVGPMSGTAVFGIPPKKYLFVLYAPIDKEAQVLTKYAVETLKKKRVAVVHLNDDLGKAGLSGIRKQLAIYGMKTVEEIPVSVTETDMRPHMMRLRRSEADVVIQYTNYHHAAKLMVAAKIANYNPAWMGGSPISDFRTMWKLTKGAAKGLISAITIEGPESQHPVLLLYKRIFDKYAVKGEKWNNNWYAGMIMAEAMVEGLKLTGRDLTRENFVKGMERIKNFQGISGPISFKPFDPNDNTCRIGQTSYFLIECMDKGYWKKLSGWIKVAD